MASELINWKSKELFINLDNRDIPPRGHVERKAFVDWEKGKCLGGVTINGVLIPPTLYWTICHWALEIDELDEWGIVVKQPGRPNLRDNDWIIHNGLYDAEKAGEDLLEGGSRQIGKSVNTSAVLGRDLCLIKGCQDLLVVGSTNDRNIILSYLDFGMLHCTDFFRVPKIDKDKKSTLIRYGITLPNNEAKIKSQLHVRNTEEGQNTEVSAGVSIYRAVFDEIGKYPYAKSHETVKPATISKFGKRSSSILTFTGGDVAKVQDAQNSFLNPRSSGFKAYSFDGKETGLFLDGTHRQDFKDPMTLSEYLKVEKGSELDTVTINVTNKERALATLEQEYADLVNDPIKTKAIMHKVYYALKVNDMFLRVDANPYGPFIERLQQHKEFLQANPIGPGPVDIFRNMETGQVEWRFSEKFPISSYPRKDTDRLDAPFVMYDPPKHKESYLLHTAGLDPYNQSVTETSPSLGSFYITRRANLDLSDPFQNRMVLSWTARPEDMRRDFLGPLRLALELYGATMLHENSNAVVVNDFDAENAMQMLVDSYNIQHQINPHSKAKTQKGIAPTTPNLNYRTSANIEYLQEEINVRYDEQGNKKFDWGLTRINDPLLCEELIAFNDEGNFDRVDAFGWNNVYNKYLNVYHKLPDLVPDRIEQKKPIQPPRNPWIGNGNTKKVTTPSSPWMK